MENYLKKVEELKGLYKEDLKQLNQELVKRQNIKEKHRQELTIKKRNNQNITEEELRKYDTEKLNIDEIVRQIINTEEIINKLTFKKRVNEQEIRELLEELRNIENGNLATSQTLLIGNDLKKEDLKDLIKEVENTRKKIKLITNTLKDNYTDCYDELMLNIRAGIFESLKTAETRKDLYDLLRSIFKILNSTSIFQLKGSSLNDEEINKYLVSAILKKYQEKGYQPKLISKSDRLMHEDNIDQNQDDAINQGLLDLKTNKVHTMHVHGFEISTYAHLCNIIFDKSITNVLDPTIENPLIDKNYFNPDPTKPIFKAK